MNGAPLLVKKPLTMRLLKRLLGFSAGVIVLLAGARAWWEYQGTLDAVREEFAVIENTKARSLAGSLWDFDRKQLALHVEGIRHFRFITYAGVSDATGLVAQAGVRRDTGVLDRKIPLYMVYNSQRQDLGVLHVQADLEALRGAAWRTAWLVLSFNSGLVLLVAGLLFWLTRNMISRHLEAFAEHLGRYSLGGDNKPLKLDKKPAGDELDVLAAALNAMQDGLASSYGQVLAAQAEVRTLARFPQENPNPVLRVGAGGQLLMANPASRELLAYLGAKVGQPLPAEQAAITSRALAHGEMQRFELDMDGKTFDFTASPVSAEGFVNLYGLDISERKRAENALRASEAILQAAMDQSQAGIAIAEAPSGRLRYVNKVGQKIRGVGAEGGGPGAERDQFVSNWGMLDLDRRPLALTEMPLARAVMFGETSSREFILCRAEGDESIVWANAAPILDERGEVSAGIVVFLDITARKLAEEELRQTNARLRSLVRVLQHKGQSVQDFLNVALTEALALTESSLGYIYHYSEERREFVLNTWSSEVMQECAVKGPPTVYQLDTTGIWGEAVRQRKPLIVNDFQAANPLRRGYPEGHVHLRNFMTVPVLLGERIVAVAGVANKDGDYQDADVQQLSLLMDACWQVVGRLDAEQDVRRSLHEKEILLKEIHHRVKNNLQIISSLLFLQAEYVLDPQDRAMFEESQKRIAAMALVHEELYGSGDLSSVCMGEYVPRLVGRVVDSSDTSIQVAFDVEAMRLPVTRSIPCGLVLNEMVMNAVKHAFKARGGGRLSVTLHRHDGQVELAVQDNGPGLPPNFDLESPSTLGLTLITSLAHQLGGSVSAQSVATGARFALVFPQEE